MGNASAAFLVEAHDSGLAWENFDFGGDTFSASASIPSTAVGTTATNSIFGGDGSGFPDTYVFTYTPGSDDDNVTFVAGTVLGSKDDSPGTGELASGLMGGESGRYNVYITSPASVNVNGAPSTFTVTQEGDPIVLEIDPNSGGTGDDTQITPEKAFVGGMNNAWYLLTGAEYAAGESYTVTMEAGTNTFVSQRIHGVMWEYAPISSERGDFNQDGVLDDLDIDILSSAVREGLTDPEFDLNNDGDVDDGDRTVWVEEVRKTYFGDANMDDVFDSLDFVAVFSLGEYEDNVPQNSRWASGDWNGDTEFDSLDFVTAFVGGGYEEGPRTDAMVPEPGSWLLLVLGALPLAGLRRNRTRRFSLR